MHQSQRAPIRLGWREALQCMGSYTHTHKHTHTNGSLRKNAGRAIVKHTDPQMAVRSAKSRANYGNACFVGVFVKSPDFPPEGNIISSQTRVASRSKTNPRQTAHSSSSLCIHRILGHKQGQALPFGGSSALSFRNPGAGTEPPTCMRLWNLSSAR